MKAAAGIHAESGHALLASRAMHAARAASPSDQVEGLPFQMASGVHAFDLSAASRKDSKLVQYPLQIFGSSRTHSRRRPVAHHGFIA